MEDALLDAALAARDRLLAAEATAEYSRLNYQWAIRRFHASGASLREIAEALGLSHQRVHQLVNGGGDMTAAFRKQSLFRRLVGRRRPGCDARRPITPLTGAPLDRFSVDARDALTLAEEEARALHHDYLGTEHLLLGLLRAERGPVARLLAAAGIDVPGTRAAIARLLGGADSGGARRALPVTMRLNTVLELGRREARERHSTHVRSEHLLLALAREGEGVGARILAEHGVVYASLRRRLDRADLACSFCARNGLDVDHLVAGPGVFICERCVEAAARFGQGSDGAPPVSAPDLVARRTGAPAAASAARGELTCGA